MCGRYGLDGIPKELARTPRVRRALGFTESHYGNVGASEPTEIDPVAGTMDIGTQAPRESSTATR